MTDKETIVQRISKLPNLSAYNIRDLVADAKSLGEYLATQKVKTNQIRKFLDAINRLKFDLSRGIAAKRIDTELVMLRPKLAYAVGRAEKGQKTATKELSDVMSTALSKIREVKDDSNLENFKDDFERLVQLIESIIAYHKTQGGE